MVSAAEQLASNLSFDAFSKSAELRNRIWFTLGALIVYRFGTYLPLPGVDPQIYGDAFQSSQTGILGMFNVFSGGAVSRMAIFALNIMPYITASIIIQLLTAVYEPLAQLKKEGEQGRKIINQYTRIGTVFLASVQAYGIAVGLEALQNVVISPGWFFRLTTVVTLTGGTVFLMWLGEQITSRGIGNGISLIIFSGIVAQFPFTIAQLLDLGRTGSISVFLQLLIVVAVLLLIVLIVFAERAQRRIFIQYPRRQIGNKQTNSQSSHLPLKINTAGVIPPIFASALLSVPATIASFASTSSNSSSWFDYLIVSLGPGAPLHIALYCLLIVFFAFFYTAIVFNPDDTADNLRQNGGFLPGIRPGAKTSEYLDYVLTRLTVAGSFYLVLVCIFPEILVSYTGISMFLGGTSLMIVVSVTLDTVAQIQGHLLASQYDSLIKKSRLKGGGKRR